MQMRFDIKSKGLIVFTSKDSNNMTVFVQQVDNYLYSLGGSDFMQVLCMGTLSHGTTQLWFQREYQVGRRSDSL